jgi:hypothetical protein
MEPAKKMEIRIQQALTAIRTSLDIFPIEFIKADGSGRVRKERVCLGVPPSRKKIAAASGNPELVEPPKRNWNHNINASHNLLLYDMDAKHPFEIKICLLMSWNNLNILWHVPKK